MPNGDRTEQPRYARSTDRTEIKLSIGYALGDRLVPIACTIVKNLKRSTKLIENGHPLPLRQSGLQAKNNTAWIGTAVERGGVYWAMRRSRSVTGLPGPADEQNSTGCFLRRHLPRARCGPSPGSRRRRSHSGLPGPPPAYHGRAAVPGGIWIYANLANRGVFAACVCPKSVHRVDLVWDRRIHFVCIGRQIRDSAHLEHIAHGWKRRIQRLCFLHGCTTDSLQPLALSRTQRRPPRGPIQQLSISSCSSLPL